MITSTALMALQLILTSTPPSMTGQIPMLHISNVKQIDNLDRGTPLGKNRADFYANVTVNGVLTQTEKFATDNGDPDWKIMLDTKKRINTIKIALWDDDGGLAGNDDHSDINPSNRTKDIIFTYDRYTGKIRGDVRGSFNDVMTSKGMNDEYQAQISFRITK
ncbi:MAG: hypothetical protein ACKVQS_07495 [Fimbriimonadaceae bacterium]